MLSIKILSDLTYEDDAYLYWIKTPEMYDISTEGYVGVTTDIKSRMKQHAHKLRKGNCYYHGGFRKQFSLRNLECYIVDCGSELEMYHKEFLLRPEKSIGWNYAVGGENAGVSELPFDIGGVKCSIRKVSKILGISIHAVGKRRTTYGFSLLEAVGAETRVDCGHFCNYPTKTGYKRLLKPLVEIEEKSLRVVDLYKNEKNCAKIGQVVGLSQDVVQFIVSEKLGVKFPDVVTCCYDGVWFSMRTCLSPDDLYHIVKMLSTGVRQDDVATIYSLEKHNVRAISSVYRRASAAQNKV